MAKSAGLSISYKHKCRIFRRKYDSDRWEALADPEKCCTVQIRKVLQDYFLKIYVEGEEVSV